MTTMRSTLLPDMASKLFALSTESKGWQDSWPQEILKILRLISQQNTDISENHSTTRDILSSLKCYHLPVNETHKWDDLNDGFYTSQILLQHGSNTYTTSKQDMMHHKWKQFLWKLRWGYQKLATRGQSFYQRHLCFRHDAGSTVLHLGSSNLGNAVLGQSALESFKFGHWNWHGTLVWQKFDKFVNHI